MLFHGLLTFGSDSATIASMDSKHKAQGAVELGRTVGTSAVVAAMEDLSFFSIFVINCMARHEIGDWGDLDKSDAKANDEALVEGERILSAYMIPQTFAAEVGQTKLWVITEADRSVTTVLWPSEY